MHTRYPAILPDGRILRASRYTEQNLKYSAPLIVAPDFVGFHLALDHKAIYNLIISIDGNAAMFSSSLKHPITARVFDKYTRKLLKAHLIEYRNEPFPEYAYIEIDPHNVKTFKKPYFVALNDSSEDNNGSKTY